MINRLLTPEDVAERLQCSTNQARKIVSGIVGRQASWKTKIDEETFAAYCKSREVSPLSGATGPESYCVYFIQAVAGGLIKIGVAQNLALRMRGLQASCPIPLRLLARMAGRYRETERELHIRFAHLREHGEWFRPEPELLELIASIGVES